MKIAVKKKAKIKDSKKLKKKWIKCPVINQRYGTKERMSHHQ
jgi:hypothetical protein